MPRETTVTNIVRTEQHSKVVLVTPQMAADWLTRNARNRPISYGRVEAMSEDMILGNWKQNHQGIAFSAEGNLLDGQHRLSAIVKAEKSITLKVDFNVDASVMDTIDTGGIRSVCAIFQIEGVPYANQICSRAITIRNIENPGHQGRKMTVAQTKAMYLKYREGLDWSLTALGPYRIFGGAPFGGAMAYAFPSERKKVPIFANQVREGENISKRDPAYWLRRFLMDGKINSETSRREAIIASLRCLHAFLHGQELGVLKLNALSEDKDGTMVRIFNYFRKPYEPKSA